MDYKGIYDSLISRSQSRTIDGYTERHHIIPRCMGGNDDHSNITRLTPEEHYVAHQLLVKIYPNHFGLVQAAQRMCTGRSNNKLYGWLRRRLSENAKQRIGPKNGMFGSMWITNGSKAKCVKDGIIPDGWYRGRVPKTEPKPSYQSKCKSSAEDRYKQFLESGLSLRKFAASIGVSQPNLTKIWKRHGITSVPSYISSTPA